MSISKELISLLNKYKPITVNARSIAEYYTKKDTGENEEPSTEIDISKIIKARTKNKGELSLSFFMTPNDKDFPYDIPFLHFSLIIPKGYPKFDETPFIMVLNDDIPRGFAYNIELGFKDIAALIVSYKRKNPELNLNKTEVDIKVVGGHSLRGMVDTLDKYLETFLGLEKKETIKIVKVKQSKKEKEKETKKKDSKSSSEVKERQNQNKQQNRESLIDKSQIHELKCSFQSIKTVKETPTSSIYKLSFPLQEPFIIEFDAVKVEMINLCLKISINRRISLEMDISNGYLSKLLNELGKDDENKAAKLVFGKLLTNVGKNFGFFTLDVKKRKEEWTLVEFVNFVSGNLQKFMSEPADFSKWLGYLNELRDGANE
ncbi:hypothetical protein DAMA08_018420 [Martiniozyma asiatica (nom. inval.)]|nr:hypothetical protein DAMA08_018420 [Martiniozyma asiatica]